MVTGSEAWAAKPPILASLGGVGLRRRAARGAGRGMARGYDAAEMLRLGVAAGGANTLTVGAGRVRREDVEAILPRVSIERLP